jgi:hypothetical protein
MTHTRRIEEGSRAGTNKNPVTRRPADAPMAADEPTLRPLAPLPSDPKRAATANMGRPPSKASPRPWVRALAPRSPRSRQAAVRAAAAE